MCNASSWHVARQRRYVNRSLRTIIGALVVAVHAVLVPQVGAEPKTEAIPTDPDYQVQGEYAGDIATPAGKQPLGVQVIAEGQGKFHAVLFQGGLPGTGAD